MTNDLMRDVIEGRIPVVVSDPFRHVPVRIMLGAGNESIASHVHGPIPVTDPIELEQGRYFKYVICVLGCTLDPPPADPRERALRAKQQRGTGPEVPVRERGLVTKYKEKS